MLLAALVVVVGAGCGGGGTSGPPDGPDVSPDAPLPDADVTQLDNFSFFVTSLVALQDLSGSQAGFGGDLRFGETGPGAGLRGADKLCATIADRSMPGASAKRWRAFLSAADDGAGNPVHAIDRIGTGPWYDRLGRVFASSVTNIVSTRPEGGDALIRDDFPNEDGVPNHQPDVTMPEVDNHDMLTGTDANGHLFGAASTCLDWTSAVGDLALDGRPRVGHSWPRSAFPPDLALVPGPWDLDHWMSALDESGCAPGVNLIETGPPDPESNTVGSGGGYGGFYCFSLDP
jgi:hypothetical protein